MASEHHPRHRRQQPERRQGETLITQFPSGSVKVTPVASTLTNTNVNTDSLVYNTGVQDNSKAIPTNNPTTSASAPSASTSGSQASPVVANAGSSASTIPVGTLVGVCVSVFVVLAGILFFIFWWTAKQKKISSTNRNRNFPSSASPYGNQHRGHHSTSAVAAGYASTAPPGEDSFLSLKPEKGERERALNRELKQKKSREFSHMDTERAEMERMERSNARREAVEAINNPFHSPPSTAHGSMSSSGKLNSAYGYPGSFGKKASEKDLKAQARVERERDMIALENLISALDSSAERKKNPGQRYEARHRGKSSTGGSLDDDSDFPLPPPEVFRAALGGRSSRDEVQ